VSINIDRGRAADSLSLMPLIDVVFLLLVFFLVASRFAQEDRQLPVALPNATAAMPMTMQPRELTINVSVDGSYVVQGETLGLEQLQQALQQAVADNPLQQRVLIRADRRAEFQLVVNVMDLCNQAGVVEYRVATLPAAAGG
jgi:biopolymer transport protein ExbD